MNRVDVSMLPPHQLAILNYAKEVAASLEVEAFLVGGPLRDLLLGAEVRDLDFTLASEAGAFARELRNRTGGELKRFEAFQTFKIVLEDTTIDVTTARKETYPQPGSLPVVAPGTIEDDLARRDFSINAMALALRAESLLDPIGGSSDLDRRLIRILHERSFLDDPTRMFRAIRFKTRLGFSLDGLTRHHLEAALHQGALRTVSRERLWRELRLVLGEPDPAATLSELRHAGLLGAFLGPTRPVADDALRRSAPRNRDQALALFLSLAFESEAAFDLAAPGIGLPLKRMQALRRVISERDSLLETLRAKSPEKRLQALIDLSPDVLDALAALDGELKATADQINAMNQIDLGIRGDELEVPPGPHIGHALRATKRALILGQIDAAGALAFARNAAIRYLSAGGMGDEKG